MRFVLDQDVDAEVADMLRKHGHDAWTAAEAGLSDAQDDDLTVYAHRRHAAVVTHDREFTVRRKRFPIGGHVRLKCPEPDAVELLARYLDMVVAQLGAIENITVVVSPESGARGWMRWDNEFA